jgi:hypothetical protein
VILDKENELSIYSHKNKDVKEMVNYYPYWTCGVNDN